MRKITANWKDKGSTRIELLENFRDFAKLFWMVPSKILSQLTKTFTKLTVKSIVSLHLMLLS